jgi:hypothetical protein
VPPVEICPYTIWKPTCATIFNPPSCNLSVKHELRILRQPSPNRSKANSADKIARSGKITTQGAFPEPPDKSLSTKGKYTKNKLYIRIGVEWRSIVREFPKKATEKSDGWCTDKQIHYHRSP